MSVLQLPKRILVTGGGTGIGLAIVGALIERGSQVVAVGRRPEPLKEAEALGAETARWDVTQNPNGLLKKIGSVDGLVLNAGQFQFARCEDWNADHWRQIMQVNVEAPALLAHSFLAQCTGAGAIVSIASTLAQRPAPGTGAYAASKAALLAMTKNIALECAPRQIRANAILPGVVMTAMTRPKRGDHSASEREKAIQQLHPLGRTGETAEVAQATLTALGNPWMTGSEIVIDGGLLVRE